MKWGQPQMIKHLIHNWERKLSSKDNNRIIRPFDWGAEYLHGDPIAVYSNNKTDRQRETVFRFNKAAISGSRRFFSSDTTPAFSLEHDWLTFESPLATRFPENNTVYGRYFPVGDNDGRVHRSP